MVPPLPVKRIQLLPVKTPLSQSEDLLLFVSTDRVGSVMLVWLLHPVMQGDLRFGVPQS